VDNAGLGAGDIEFRCINLKHGYRTYMCVLCREGSFRRRMYLGFFLPLLPEPKLARISSTDDILLGIFQKKLIFLYCCIILFETHVLLCLHFLYHTTSLQRSRNGFFQARRYRSYQLLTSGRRFFAAMREIDGRYHIFPLLGVVHSKREPRMTITDIL